MARGNIPLIALNRGLLSPKALARTDLDRTRLSAEIMTNWLPATQGSMRMRPGTKYSGSSFNDTGAFFVEFVASTDQTALLELTNDTGQTAGGVMRIWLPSDTGNTWETPVTSNYDLFVPMARPQVSASVSVTDTGWDNTSSGGIPVVSASLEDLIPKMTGYTTDGVTMSASSENTNFSSIKGNAWAAADNTSATVWLDTGPNEGGTLPSWLNIDFDTGNPQAVGSYAIQAFHQSVGLDNVPSSWRLITGDYDTGTYATDTGKWTVEDIRTGEINWSIDEKRNYTLPGADTGTIETRRHWRLYVTAVSDTGGSGEIALGEIELFEWNASAAQVKLQNNSLIMNATAVGSLARREKRVVVDTGEYGLEHALNINIERGPITFRVGSSSGDDDYISETSLGTGYHNLAFEPNSDFYITFQTDEQLNRIIDSISISDTGTVEIQTPWYSSVLDDIRYDQSADVVFVDCNGVRPQRIERRGTGRSWSVIDYAPDNGPFRSSQSSTAKLEVSQTYGNTKLTSDIPFFRQSHEGALFRLTHNGQSGTWFLGNDNAFTDVIEMTGYRDTGAALMDTGVAESQERQIRFVKSGPKHQVTVERSFDGPDIGFHDVTRAGAIVTASDSGTLWVTDQNDNLQVWYRCGIQEGDYNNADTGGATRVDAYYFNGIRTGIGRVTGYNSNTSVDIEVLDRFTDTGPALFWEEGSWSTLRGYPQVPTLHEGRLFHAGKANIWGSVSDDFENFNDETEGESAPLSKTLGSGPVDDINFMISLIRLILGTDGREISIRSSSLDEPLTVENSSAKPFSTLGSSGLRALAVDSRAIFVQRSGQKLFSVGFGTTAETFGDFESKELTLLVPELMQAGVRSITVQRQPDTRIHCVLNDGKVAILTYESQEEVLAWSLWESDTGINSQVERAMVLPGVNEDKVFYHIKRTIDGSDKRYLEQWAMETEAVGDTGHSWLADCAIQFADTGTVSGFDHVEGEPLIVWVNDTGQNNNYGKDLSPGEWGNQTTFTPSSGSISGIPTGVTKGVGGLRLKADWKSTKLAYAAQAGTALGQEKRTAKLAVIAADMHNSALYYGADTGTGLDPLPRRIDGAVVDADKIFTAFDHQTFPLRDRWNVDSRLFLRAVGPRPVELMGIVLHVTTQEDV